MELKKVAEETKTTLPVLLNSLPNFHADASSVHDLSTLAPLDPSKCPRYTLPQGDKDAGRVGTRIRVLDKDSFDAAIELQPSYKAQVHLSNISGTATSPPSPDDTGISPTTDDEEMDLDGLPLKATSHPWDLSTNPTPPNTTQPTPSTPLPTRTTNPVAVLNLASDRHPGGGWQNGAMAQEEALCYRSSLSLSLHKSYYPLPAQSAIYTPNVLIIRTATSAGHTLYTTPPPDLPITSVISVAALRHPALSHDKTQFHDPAQRAQTKAKIRLSLRIAASMGHTKLVLGALGCGVFGNPPQDVAECFLEVLRETEFRGGWWEEMVFAVLDNKGVARVGNWGEFGRVLQGRVV
jgi:uncharacterized protein (TIGR02452 family)